MGWISPNHEYLKGIRDGILFANKIIDSCGLDEMQIKHVNTELAKKMVLLGNLIDAVTKAG